MGIVERSCPSEAVVWVLVLALACRRKAWSSNGSTKDQLGRS